MSYKEKIIVTICAVIILLTLRIKRTDDGFTIQFGIWQLFKNTKLYKFRR